MHRAVTLTLPALATVGALSIQPVLAETLTREQVSRQIIDRDLTATHNGMTVRLRYNSDGSIVMKVAFMSGVGNWVYVGDELCMTLTKGPKRGKTCVTFEGLGNGTYRNSEGLILHRQK